MVLAIAFVVFTLSIFDRSRAPREEVAKETVAAFEETLRIVDLRFEEGMVSAQDQALVRSELATARERQETVAGSERDALRSLEILLGRYPGAELRSGMKVVRQ